MSHYTVTVLLPRQPEDAEDLESILAELLEPFDENKPVAEPYKDYADAPVFDAERNRWNWPYCVAADDGLTIDPENLRPVAEHLRNKWPDGYGANQYEEETNRIYGWTTYNPNSRWDWWVVGGRWTGYMPLKEGAQGITGKPSWGNPEGAKPGWVDCIRKGDIDEHAVLAEASRQALEDHEKIEAKVLNGEKLLPWDEVMPLDERINAYTKGRLRTYAFLAEGVWREPGKMGWFGMSHATPETEDDYAAWWERMWAAMPDDVWLAVIDAHI